MEIQEPTPNLTPKITSKPLLNNQILELDFTLTKEELVQKCLKLQERLQGKTLLTLAQVTRLEESKVEHKQQALENKTLKEYIANLLKTTNRLGLDAPR